MPRSPTTGIFTRVSNSFSEPITGTVIDPTDAIELFNDYDSGLTFDDGEPLILIGSTSGVLTIKAPDTASGTLTFPSGTTDFQATGGTGQFVKQASAGAPFTVSTVPASELAGLGTGVATALAINVGSAGAFVTFNGAGGTPSSITLTNATGLPVATGISGLGTGIATALAVNVGSAGAPVLFNGSGGTPSSLTLTNASGLPVGGLAAQAAYTFVGNNTGSSATPTAVDIAGLTTKASPAAGDYIMLSDQDASGAWKKATVSSVASAGSVSSIAGNTGAFTLGVGLTNVVNDLRVSLSTLTNSLGADVALNNTANYFTGPTVAQGTSGTWFASGSVTVTDSSAAVILAKLWDGTTVICEGSITLGAGFRGVIALSGYISSPAGNIRISVRDASNTSGSISYNDGGNGKSATLSAIRIT